MKRENTYSPISCLFSKHDFIQPALFTLLAMKIYTRSTYRQITDLLELSDTIQNPSENA